MDIPVTGWERVLHLCDWHDIDTMAWRFSERLRFLAMPGWSYVDPNDGVRIEVAKDGSHVATIANGGYMPGCASGIVPVAIRIDSDPDEHDELSKNTVVVVLDAVRKDHLDNAGLHSLPRKHGAFVVQSLSGMTMEEVFHVISESPDTTIEGVYSFANANQADDCMKLAHELVMQIRRLPDYEYGTDAFFKAIELILDLAKQY